jgi:hypothetical protein
MALPLLPLLIVVGGGLAWRAHRRKKAATTTARHRRVVDQGRAYAASLNATVDWDVYRQGLKYGWVYSVVGLEDSLVESDPVFDREDEAYHSLDLSLSLEPLPSPEGAEEPETTLGEAASWHPPPPGSKVYPPGESVKDAPALADPEGIVFSDDCAVVVIGPDWWDKVGDIIAATNLQDTVALEDVVLQTEFPPGCDLAARGASRLRTELRQRIHAYVQSQP